MPRLIGAAQAVTNITQNAVITTFNSSGTFTAATHTTNAWILAVAGGGGAASQGSGGGAGGHLEVPSHPVPSSGVPVTIGAGGAAGTGDPFPGSNGANTVFGAASPLRL